MRRLRLEELETGMIVGRSIYSSDSRILLAAGVMLNNNYIHRLRELGIYSVYIKDELTGEIDFPEIISEKTRIKAVRTIKENFGCIEKDRYLNIQQVKDMVEDLISEIITQKEVLFSLMDVNSYDDYTFAHSVNVCLISIIIGISLRYDRIKLTELGIGALLHDIGKTHVDRQILNKKDILTTEEYEEIKRHPEYGFDILRTYQDISLLSSHVAYQHHERWDGTGYPRGIKGKDIHEYARIVAAADVYDALMGDRPYRPPFTVDQAIAEIRQMRGTHLDPRIVGIMIANIAVYPVGSLIQLSTGDIAIVVKVRKLNPTQPVVRVIFTAGKKKVGTYHEIDLASLPTIRIIHVLGKNEINNISALLKQKN
ncbi:MAG: HD-GYP domain-containing protein [Syntrophomonadaceae bacterium]|nr:HD-GYP domain-containing protein [Syntrophomonadaceae bacterium]MDD3889385.1 HD-GYP domain-containing protein [Syntrophomonadaceae bacterium]MDD4548450.1 HD-GYP domain-containing protein [Syntrophomonadaceae bacterium]